MRIRFHNTLLMLLTLIGLGLALPLQAQSDKLKVVASFSILGNMVQVLGGDRVEVTTLVGANSDGHIYQPKPSDGAKLMKADLVIINGLHFEGWIPRLINSTGYSGPQVTATEGIEPLYINGEPDPHAWQSLTNARIYADNITEALIRQAPQHRAYFDKKKQAFYAEIDALQRTVQHDLSAIPEARRLVVTNHDAFGYLGREFNIRFMAPLGMSTDSAAGAGSVAELIWQIKRNNIRAVFVENISDPRLIEQISRETGVSLGGSLYSDALSDADGPAASYLQMMKHNIRLITQALTGGDSKPPAPQS